MTQTSDQPDRPGLDLTEAIEAAVTEAGWHWAEEGYLDLDGYRHTLVTSPQKAMASIVAAVAAAVERQVCERYERVGCMAGGMVMRGHFGPCDPPDHQPIYVVRGGAS